jgi:cytochrome P450
VDTPLQILTSSQGDRMKGAEDHPSALKYDFHDPAFYNNPYPYYRRMQQEDPLWHNPISGHWVVTRYHDVMEILHSPQCSNYRLDELMRRVPDNRNDEAASLRAAFKDRLLFLEGEGHLRIRKLIMHAFRSDSIQRQKPLVAEVVEDVLDHLDPSSPVDLVANATNLVPGRVILHILGFPEEKQPEMKEWTDDVYAWLGTASGTIEERTERAVEAVQRLTEAIRSEVTRVRQSPRSDVLTAMVQAEDEGHQLTDDELVANVIGLINAGQETTTCLLANGMLALFTHPEEWDRLRAQPGFGKRRSTSSCVTSHRPSSLLVESSLPSRFAALLLTEGRLFQWDLARPIAIPSFSPIQIASISAARRDAFSPLDSDLTSASAPPWPTSKPPSFSTRSRPVTRNCN